MSDPIIIAHRGAPEVAPENTLASFQAAIDMGVKALELDILLTKDNRLVVHHDEELGRIVKGEGKVREMTLAEIQSFPIEGTTEHAPALEDVLDLCRGKCHVAVEAKTWPWEVEAITPVLAENLKKNAKPEEVTLISFCKEFIGKVRELAPGFPYGPSFQEEHEAEEAIRFDPAVVVMKHTLAQPELMDGYADHQLPVWVYTVDDPARGQKLASLGVSGIITNRPDYFL